MKQTYISIFLTICLSLTSLQAKVKNQESELINELEIRSSGIVRKAFIPPAAPVHKKRLYTKAGENNTINGNQLFKVTYDEAVPSKYRTAIEYALDIWENHITSEIPITVHINWDTSNRPGVLASAGASSYFLLPETSYIPPHYAPVPIAERKLKRELNNEADINVSIVSSTDSYYFGTDGNCPAKKHDLVTIMIHEICHGLGFSSSARHIAPDPKDFTLGGPKNDKASLGFNGGEYGKPYDYFLVGEDGEKIMNRELYPNGSKELFKALSNTKLYFDGNLTKMSNSGSPAHLFAPFNWDPGSSVSHLNQTSLTSGSQNILMEPKAYLGLAVHNPGPIVNAILGDIGWDHVWIDHQELKDTEDTNTALKIIADIKSDSALIGNPVIAYREPAKAIAGQELPFTETPLVFDAQTQKYVHTVQLDGTVKEFEYYIKANASGERTFIYPAAKKINPIKVSVGPDTKAPVITNNRVVEYVRSNETSVEFPFSVQDNIALSTIVTEIWLDDQKLEPTTITPQPNESIFNRTLNPIDLTGVKNISYRFTATDASSNKNKSTLPETGLFTLKVETIRDAIQSFSTSFDSGKEDWILEGFDITTPAGFTSATLGSEHPYQNNEIGRLNFYAYLKQKILVQNGTTISFDEIVLVEPGKDDAVAGTEKFFDFVAVEASIDEGKTWTAITSPWDSAAHQDWLTEFNKNMKDNNSTTTGTPAMLKKRTISFDQSPDFKAGDQVMIRFRLLSDPLSVGWGWTIDNLQIGVQ